MSESFNLDLARKGDIVQYRFFVHKIDNDLILTFGTAWQTLLYVDFNKAYIESDYLVCTRFGGSVCHIPLYKLRMK